MGGTIRAAVFGQDECDHKTSNISYYFLFCNSTKIEIEMMFK